MASSYPVSDCSVGLIANVGSTGSKGDIDLIKSFAATYIKKPSCIILLTVTCESKHLNCFPLLLLT
jgi:hypothetical protein